MNSRTRWLLIALAGLALIGFVISGGHDRDDASSLKDDDKAPVTETVSFPMPQPEAIRSGKEEARGLYVLKAGDRSFTLDLEHGSRFRMVVSIAGKPPREARGTWSLVGKRLTMAYHVVPGRPEITAENPDVVVNTWYGDRIELADTGSVTPVVLRKRTAFRQR